jgi:FkbM family methyltransferase
VKGRLQRVLLAGYRILHGTGLLSTPAGRRAFLSAYGLYKRWVDAPVEPLRQHVREGEWIVDVGANVGHLCVQFARWTRGGGRVLAIEPEPHNLAALRASLRRTGLESRVLVMAGVAAEAEGELQLTLNPHNPADHRLGERGIPVRAYVLDRLLAEQGDPPVGLVKIDVQGAEPRVIEGALATLARCRPALFVEIDDQALREAGSSAQALMERLATLGYDPVDLHAPQRRLRMDEVQGACGELGYADILFLPGSR